MHILSTILTYIARKNAQLLVASNSPCAKNVLAPFITATATGEEIFLRANAISKCLEIPKTGHCINFASYSLWGRFVLPQNKVRFRPLQETLQRGNHKTATHCFNFGAAIMGSRNFSWPTASREENTQNAAGQVSGRDSLKAYKVLRISSTMLSPERILWL